MGGRLSGAFSIFPNESFIVLKKFSTKLVTIRGVLLGEEFFEEAA